MHCLRSSASELEHLRAAVRAGNEHHHSSSVISFGMLALVLLLRPQKLAETQVLHLDLEFKKVRLFAEWRVINRSAFVART